MVLPTPTGLSKNAILDSLRLETLRCFLLERTNVLIFQAFLRKRTFTVEASRGHRRQDGHKSHSDGEVLSFDEAKPFKLLVSLFSGRPAV